MNVNPLRIERLLRMAIVPFLSAGALVGTGFSLWVFNAEAEADPVSAKGTLTVAARAEVGTLIIGEPLHHDEYRLIFDQGGEAYIYDENAGVYLQPEITCTLTNYEPSAVEDYLIRYEFGCFNAEGTAIGGCAALSHGELTTTCRNFAPLGLTCPTPGENGLYPAIQFSLTPTFRWVSGTKPLTSLDWAKFNSEIAECAQKGYSHRLTIVIDNNVA